MFKKMKHHPNNEFINWKRYLELSKNKLKPRNRFALVYNKPPEKTYFDK